MRIDVEGTDAAKSEFRLGILCIFSTGFIDIWMRKGVYL